MVESNLGIIVPPANPTVEVEFRHILPSVVNYYVARLPVLDGELEQRLTKYNSRLEETAASLTGLNLGVIIAACTGSSYPLGKDGDRRLAEKFGSVLGSVKSATSAGSILRVLAALKTKNVWLLSPYPEWLTKKSVSFWESSGIAVEKVFKIPGSGKIYDLNEQAVEKVLLDAIKNLGKREDVVLVVVGTGAPSIHTLDKYAPNMKNPLISSNLASAWFGLRALDPTGLMIEQSQSEALRTLNKKVLEAQLEHLER